MRYLQKSVIAAVLAGVVSVAPFPAQAENVCGRKVHHKFSDVRIFSRDYVASCHPGGTCRLVTHVFDKAAPLGFSHTLTFQRKDKDASWQVLLVDVLQLADTTNGFVIATDKSEGVNIAAQSISTPKSVNEYSLDETSSAGLLEQAKPANRVSWAYKTADGTPQSVTFSLIGLSKAMEWAECAQGALASGKSAQHNPASEEPEYSAPEPDVPVQPVSDKD